MKKYIGNVAHCDHEFAKGLAIKTERCDLCYEKKIAPSAMLTNETLVLENVFKCTKCGHSEPISGTCPCGFRIYRVGSHRN